jgi:hypothetical protein
MPLNKSGSKAVSDDERKAIGIWMTVEGKHPVQPIKVFATYEALSAIEPTIFWDLHGAFEIFTRNRVMIEGAASRKFDTKGVDHGEHEGQPVLMIRTEDLPKKISN